MLISYIHAGVLHCFPDCNICRGLHENPFDLITLTLKFAAERLHIPAIKVTDIFAGRSDVIYTLCVALMVLSVPTMEEEVVLALCYCITC